MHQMGGKAIYLSTKDTQLGRGESVEDAAAGNLSYGRYSNDPYLRA